jgi:K+ transporter
MGLASLLALLYTRGRVDRLLVMYSINVFLTFSLSMLGMALARFRNRRRDRRWKRRAALFAAGFSLCATILVATVLLKFRAGAWVTLLLTGSVIALCFLIRRHYHTVAAKLAQLYADLGNLPLKSDAPPGALERGAPTAAVLVGAFGGVGIHTTLNIFRTFPGHFQNLVFLTVGVIDSGVFKGEDAVESLRARTEETARKYVQVAHGLGVPATYRTAVGTDAIEEAERLCLAVAADFPQTTFFGGKVIFQRERWYQRILHNETAFAIQKRLQWAGRAMVIVPARVV